MALSEHINNDTGLTILEGMQYYRLSLRQHRVQRYDKKLRGERREGRVFVFR
jgi:hypothetical protein